MKLFTVGYEGEPLAAEKRTALLCFEADHAGCHRAVLAERLAGEDGFEVVNL